MLTFILKKEWKDVCDVVAGVKLQNEITLVCI